MSDTAQASLPTPSVSALARQARRRRRVTILVLQFALAIGALVFWEWAAVIALFVGGYLTAWAAPRDGSGPPP